MSDILTPLSVRTVALTLAYLHHYTCKYIPGRWLSVTHLRGLARWVQPGHEVTRSIRDEPFLAGCLVLAEAAELVERQSGFWLVTPATYEWLKAPLSAQIKRLLQPLINRTGWQQYVEACGLGRTIPEHLSLYWQQQLLRQSQQSDGSSPHVTWHKVGTDVWFLRLPDTLSPYLLFHLNQIGEWQPGQALRCTALTMAQAVQRGYSLTSVRTLLRRAMGKPLPDECEVTLTGWFEHLNDYRLRRVYLLSTRRAEQLQEILANRRLRQRIVEVIGPRQVIVQADMVASLNRWLERQGRIIQMEKKMIKAQEKLGQLPAAQTWLAVRVLAGLGEMIPLPAPVPSIHAAMAEHDLTEEQLTELDGLAQQIVDGVRQAIRGRDAFFPAEEPANSEILACLQEAVVEERDVEITYQSLVDKQPYPRRVSPLWLEEKGELLYLHAYCHLAEAERVFRLDRIHHCMPVQGNDSSL